MGNPKPGFRTLCCHPAVISHLGIIEVNISITKKDFYVLTFQDNGIGLPAHVDIQSASTVGLQLVWSLTQQQLGEIVCTTQPGIGTLFSVTFSDRWLAYDS